MSAIIKVRCEKTNADVVNISLRKAKSGFDVCQAGCGEINLDIMPKDLERAKASFDGFEVSRGKISVTACQAPEKQEQKKREYKITSFIALGQYLTWSKQRKNYVLLEIFGFIGWIVSNASKSI